jgi:hypothetical protein
LTFRGKFINLKISLLSNWNIIVSIVGNFWLLLHHYWCFLFRSLFNNLLSYWRFTLEVIRRVFIYLEIALSTDWYIIISIVFNNGHFISI